MKITNIFLTTFLGGSFVLPNQILVHQNLINNESRNITRVTSIEREVGSEFKMNSNNPSAYWTEEFLVRGFISDSNILKNGTNKEVKINYFYFYRNGTKVEAPNFLILETTLMRYVNQKDIWDVELLGEQHYIFLTGYRFKFYLKQSDKNNNSLIQIFDSGKKWDKNPKLSFKYSIYI